MSDSLLVRLSPAMHNRGRFLILLLQIMGILQRSTFLHIGKKSSNLSYPCDDYTILCFRQHTADRNIFTRRIATLASYFYEEEKPCFRLDMAER